MKRRHKLPTYWLGWTAVVLGSTSVVTVVPTGPVVTALFTFGFTVAYAHTFGPVVWQKEGDR